MGNGALQTWVGEGVGRAVDEALREAPPRGAASRWPTSAPHASGLELHPAQTMMLLGQLCKVSGAGAGAHLLGWLRVRSGDPGIPDVRMYTKVIGHCARERDARKSCDGASCVLRALRRSKSDQPCACDPSRRLCHSMD